MRCVGVDDPNRPKIDESSDEEEPKRLNMAGLEASTSLRHA